MKSCGWEGLGFGANYNDAGCVEGFACDLDDCEHTEEGVMIALRDELCPQCKGTGDIVDGDRGVTALYRQRAADEIKELVGEIKDEDLRYFIDDKFNCLFRLVRELEENAT